MTFIIRKSIYHPHTPPPTHPTPPQPPHPPIRTPHPAPRTPHPAPRTPHPAPRTPHPAPRTPHPAPRTPHPAPRTPHPAPRTPHPAPRTPHPAPRTPHPAPRTPHPAPRTPHPAPRTPHPAPRTPHPAPRTPHPAPRTPPRTPHPAPRTPHPAQWFTNLQNPRRYGRDKALYLDLGFVNFTRATTNCQYNLLVWISQNVSQKGNICTRELLTTIPPRLALIQTANECWIKITSAYPTDQSVQMASLVTWIGITIRYTGIIRYSNQASFMTGRFNQFQLMYSEYRDY